MNGNGDERSVIGATTASGLRRMGPLATLPFSRTEMDGESPGSIVQIKVLSKDKKEFVKIANEIQKVLVNAQIEGIAQVVLSDEKVEMTVGEIKAIAQLVIPEVIATLGLSPGMIRR
jgi:hypothetical protein